MALDLAAEIGRRFIERRDVKAWQYPDGAYRPDRTKITIGDVRAHLGGKRTMGHYLVSPEGTCRLFAFDIDLRKDAVWEDAGLECDVQPNPELGPICINDGLNGHQHWEPREAFLTGTQEQKTLLTNDLVYMAEGLARRTHALTDLPVAIAYSGRKGVHVYAFTGQIDAAVAKAAAMSVLESTGCFRPFRGDNFWRHDSAYSALEVEVFPKQGSLEGKDLGNLMRLPLGRHQAGGPGFFLRVGGANEGRLREMDAEAALGGELPWKE